MDPITDWRCLEKGMHVQLSCKCQGVIVAVKRDATPENRDTGFFMAYTVLGCQDQSSHEEAYKKGYGPYVNYFNYSLSTEATPAIETPLPEWWGENQRLVEFLRDYKR
jgi:hypothetical protein